MDDEFFGRSGLATARKQRHKPALCATCEGPLTSSLVCTRCDTILLPDVGMITRAQHHAAVKLAERVASHDYPSWPNAESDWQWRDGYGWTSDCRYGCGCWMGGSCSGRGDKDEDPFGLCPGAPTVTWILAWGVLFAQTESRQAKVRMGAYRAPEQLTPNEFAAPARCWAISAEGQRDLLLGIPMLGMGRG
jgi:hypothetical protein